jgi:hypothetical protein
MRFPHRRPTPLVALGAVLLLVTAAPAYPGAAAERPRVQQAAQDTWQLRWAPQADQEGLGAFEGVEDDRANSHPAGQPHIYPEGNNYRFNMHLVDRDTLTDRQRQEVKGMRANGADLILLKGQTWRFTQSMYIPGSLKATTTFTHIMQMKMPGTDSLPIFTVSLQRVDGVPMIQLHDFNDNLIVGRAQLTPLQNRWIDMELEMTIGDAPNGRLRWVIRDGSSTVIDVARTGLDTWLGDRNRPKWGIYRSLGDTSGSLQDCYLLLTNMRAYEWSGSSTPPSGSTYEAENATIFHGTVESNWSGYTGTGFVNTANEVGSYVQWSVNAASAGTATLTFRYANGTTTSRPMDITVNGVLIAGGLSFIPTPAWNDWDTRTVVTDLRAGTNTIRATATTANGGPNLDNLEMALSAPPPSSSVRYEAENGVCQGTIDADHTGFSGTGFCNTTNAVGAYVQWTVNAASAGTAKLTIRYANGTTASRPMTLTVNGAAAGTLDFAPTGSWDTWATATATAALATGANTIRLAATTSTGGPNLDYLEVS